MRLLERVLAVLTLMAGCVWAAYVLLLGSDAGITVPVLLVLVWGGAAILVLWAVRSVVHLLVTRRDPASRRVRRLVAEPVALALCFAFVWSGASFWVRFQFSRPSLSRYVQSTSPAIASGVFTPGIRVGLFWLREAEVLPNGVVRMITTDCMFDHCGLVYSPRGAPPVIGEDTYDALGGPWYHWWRSW
ncbi:MAG: hypothetical protein L0177_18915 [Chloroflexi bacterium]|nr:hypothetical protein [Chloroflexota bacterium]